MTQTESPFLFISYSKVDNRIARDLVELLREDFGKDYVWMDDRLEEETGEVWWDFICKKIGMCDIFVYLISNDSLESEWCRKELELANKLKKVIFPCEVRKKTKIPEDIAKLQMIFLSKDETLKTSYPELKDKLVLRWERIKQARNATPTPVGISHSRSDIKPAQSLEELILSEEVDKCLRGIRKLKAMIRRGECKPVNQWLESLKNSQREPFRSQIETGLNVVEQQENDTSRENNSTFQPEETSAKHPWHIDLLIGFVFSDIEPLISEAVETLFQLESIFYNKPDIFEILCIATHPRFPNIHSKIADFINKTTNEKNRLDMGRILKRLLREGRLNDENTQLINALHYIETGDTPDNIEDSIEWYRENRQGIIQGIS